MERFRFSESMAGLLVFLLSCQCVGQELKPRESGDPYFNRQLALRSAAASSSPASGTHVGSNVGRNNVGRNNVGRNSLQPKMPEVERPAGYPLESINRSAERPTGQPENTRRSFKTGNDFQPSGAARISPQTPPQSNNDFRPPGVGNQSLHQLQPRSKQESKTDQRPFREVRDRNFTFKQSPEFSSPVSTRPTTRVTAKTQESGLSMRTSTPGTRLQNNGGDEFEPGRVVAIVGGHPIFVGDMLFEANQLLDRFMPGAPEKVKAEQRGAVIKRLIPKFIDAKLLLIDTIDALPPEADFEKVIESAQSEFDEKALPKLVEQSGVKSPLELDAQLRAQGGSLRQMRYKWAEEQIIKYFIGRKLQVDTEVSHRDMLEVYQRDRQKYHRKARVRWEELAIRFERVPNRNEAKQLIKKMGNEVVYGAPLDAVAKRSSQGFTASDGGTHDWTSLGSLVYKDVEKALFTIPVNQLSDVIESKDGLHIVRVIERTDDSYTPFLEAQVEIRQQLENEKRNQAFEDHLKQLRQRIPFEVQLEDVELPAHLAEINGNLK